LFLHFEDQVASVFAPPNHRSEEFCPTAIGGCGSHEAASTYLKERARRRLTDEAPEFFSSTRATGPMGTTTLSFIVRTLVRASGVHFSPHVLRHSFVTHLLRSNYVAHDLAGHSHIETTMLYTKVFAKDRHENLQKLSFE
jgi:site-specific recombinase XerD